MIPFFVVVGLIVLWWRSPASQAGTASVECDSSADEIYPVQGNVITVAIQDDDAAFLFPFLQRKTREIVDRFAARGYRISPFPLTSMRTPSGMLRHFKVDQSRADIGVPRQLGPGLLVTEVQQNSWR